MLRSFHLSRLLMPAAASLILAVGCSQSNSTPGPTPLSASPTPAAAVAWEPSWPSPSSAARVYSTTSQTRWFAHESDLHSRFVLFNDGRFALQYSSVSRPFFEYLGTYRESAGSVTFDWEDRSSAGAWRATGTITDERLDLRFNTIMSLSDFEDAVYVRSRP